jgi:hypothetical protein
MVELNQTSDIRFCKQHKRNLDILFCITWFHSLLMPNILNAYSKTNVSQQITRKITTMIPNHRTRSNMCMWFDLRMMDEWQIPVLFSKEPRITTEAEWMLDNILRLLRISENAWLREARFEWLVVSEILHFNTEIHLRCPLLNPLSIRKSRVSAHLTTTQVSPLLLRLGLRCVISRIATEFEYRYDRCAQPNKIDCWELTTFEGTRDCPRGRGMVLLDFEAGYAEFQNLTFSCWVESLFRDLNCLPEQSEWMNPSPRNNLSTYSDTLFEPGMGTRLFEYAIIAVCIQKVTRRCAES